MTLLRAGSGEQFGPKCYPSSGTINRSSVIRRATAYSRFCELSWERKLSVTMRQTHVGGDKLFVDYAGDTVPMIVDRLTGELRQAQIFVAVMGASTSPTSRRPGHPNQITSWKARLESGAADVFGAGGGSAAAQPAVDVKSLHAKIGELTLENDFLEGALNKAGLLSAKR